jgi:anaerobic dimethyl sulfoxide reductase subunit C (anchor subunit)
MLRAGAAREWPLIFFTLLTQAAVGAFWALAAAEAALAAEGRIFLDARALFVILVLGGAGTLLSFFHLGRPLRAAKSLSNLRSSWISREVLADLVFLGTVAALWIMAVPDMGEMPLRTGLIVVGTAAGFILLYAMSRIYMMRTIPVWRAAHTPVSFFLAAVFLGPLLAAALTPAFDASGSAARLVFASIALAASGFGFVAMALLTPSVGWLARTRPTLLAFPERKIMRFLAVRAITLLAAAAGLAFFLFRAADGSAAPISLVGACAAALVSEFTGRALFYAMYSRIGV